jgi:hypothetical protein
MIGIYTPYDNSTVTQMALSAANLMNKLGYRVGIFASEKPLTGVCHNFDKKINYGDSLAFALWAKQCSHIFWFGCKHIHVATAINAGCKNILVVLREFISPQYAHMPDIFDHMLLPFLATYNKAVHFWGKKNIQSTRWVIDVDPVATSTEQKDICVILDRTTPEISHQGLCIAKQLLEKVDNNVHIATNRRLCLEQKNIVETIVDRYSDSVRFNNVLPQTATQYRNYGWVIYLTNNNDIPLPISRALYNGATVITHTSALTNEIIINNTFGRVIPTQVQKDNIWQLPLCPVIDSMFVSAAVDAVVQNKHIMLNQANLNFLKTEQQVFEQTLTALLQD